MSSMSSPVDTVVLDVDGTLVDSVYVHTTCWRDAFRDVGLEVASHHLHHTIGMGADRPLDLAEGAGAALQAVVSGSDAEDSKPEGELVTHALDAVGADSDTAVLLGDTVWDARSAADSGVTCIGILTGGITEAELREAGCAEVYDTPADLARGLRTSVLLGDRARS